MPSPTVLYAITALVFVGLFTWVGLVLKTYQTPWEALPTARKPRAELGKVEKDEDEEDEAPSSAPKAEASPSKASPSKVEPEVKAEDEAKKDSVDEAAKPGG